MSYNFQVLMRNVLFCVVTFGVILFSDIGSVVFADDQYEDQHISANFNLLTGYRKDDIKFSIAGDTSGQNPNILSELTWSDLQSVQIQGNGQVILFQHFVLEGSTAYAHVFSGDNQDSDYLGDNRTLEFSRSNNGSDKGSMRDFSGGIGYRFNFNEFLGTEEASIVPLIGYSYNAQNLRMQDGFQTIPSTGAFGGLDSTYETEWKGLWLGAELKGKVQALSALLRFEYHLMDFDAEANWNLRDDFAHPKSFEHSADAYGTFVTLGLGYAVSENWLFNFALDFHNYKTKRGLDRTYFSDGTSADTQLNEVIWNSYAFNAGLQYSF